MTCLGVYGGSFDPPHVAHVLGAAYALSAAPIDRLLVIPVLSHPFQKELAPFSERLRMCELAFADLARVEVSPIEADLGAPSRTLTTLRALQDRDPKTALRLIIGSDVLDQTSEWHAFEEVARLAPPFVVGRQGHPSAGGPGWGLPDISSTRVRGLLARRDEPGVEEELAALVPRRVLEYLRGRALYLASR